MSLARCRTWCPIDLQHLCCKAFIKKSIQSFNDFVLNAFHNLQITCNSRNVLLRMHIFNNCTKQQITHRAIFLTVLQSFYLIILSCKAFGLLFIFVHVSMGHTHFSMMRYAFPVSLTGLLRCFQVKNTAMKARFNVCSELPHLLFGLEKKSTFEPKLTSLVAYYRVYWAFISCIKAVFTT